MELYINVRDYPQVQYLVKIIITIDNFQTNKQTNKQAIIQGNFQCIKMRFSPKSTCTYMNRHPGNQIHTKTNKQKLN